MTRQRAAQTDRLSTFDLVQFVYGVEAFCLATRGLFSALFSSECCVSRVVCISDSWNSVTNVRVLVEKMN